MRARDKVETWLRDLPEAERIELELRSAVADDLGRELLRTYGNPISSGVLLR